MAKRTGMRRFSEVTLKAAEEAAGIGGRFNADSSDREWETLYELTRKRAFDPGDEEFLRYYLSQDRELYLECLFRDTAGYLEFLRVWLVDKAKEECGERYTRQYHRRETQSVCCVFALFFCFVLGIFGAGILVAKIFF
jgi:hypothetical protein